MRLDQEPSHVHKRTPPLSGLLCLDTCPEAVSYVLESDTAGGAKDFTFEQTPFEGGVVG
jgi:hypothetical protein